MPPEQIPKTFADIPTHEHHEYILNFFFRSDTIGSDPWILVQVHKAIYPHIIINKDTNFQTFEKYMTQAVKNLHIYNLIKGAVGRKIVSSRVD